MTVIHFSKFQLDERLILALNEKGFNRPTAIQTAAIPPAMNGCDILGSAPTGTGKTTAFLLPVLQNLLDFPRKISNAPRVLILTPTRELTMQVAFQARKLAAYTSLDIATITGGVAYMNHEKVFIENQDMVVATTGRLVQYIKEKKFNCCEVETIILDEADRMLEMGFKKDIEIIFAEARKRKQTLLFSATLAGYAIRNFAERILTNPVEVKEESFQDGHNKILQWYYRADNLQHKIALLVYMLQQPGLKKSVIFVRKRERVHELATSLRDAGINSCYLEGKMEQTRRSQAINLIMKGRVNVLIATDIAARGLDILDITHVFNFDMARTADTYLHRIGRTGRGDRAGTAISLVEAHDLLLIKKVGRYLNKPLKLQVIAELKPKTKVPIEKNNGKPSKEVMSKRIQEAVKIKNKIKTKKRHISAKNIGKRRKTKVSHVTKIKIIHA